MYPIFLDISLFTVSSCCLSLPISNAGGRRVMNTICMYVMYEYVVLR